MTGKYSTVVPQPEKWVKGSTVGAGSFGVVNLAMNKSTGELFVVKSSTSESGLHALKNEANILENISSPYIVQCLGREFSKEANGERQLNLFMEYMAGGSLSDVAQKFGGCFDESVIRQYTREILQGLEYLHKNGIAHCDLKCQNVLLSSSGKVKLADFGCAKRLNSSKVEEKSACGGTPLWMAPEVLKNEGVQFASDIWSLGCTIIEMVTGKSPWGDEVADPMAALFKIALTEETPKFPTKFSNEGVDFLKKCLQRDPKMRYSSQELLNHPFVSGPSRRNVSKEVASSPASVLDVSSCESGSESEELERRKREEMTNRIPFSMRRSSQRARSTRRRKRDYNLASSGNWITVRSG